MKLRLKTRKTIIEKKLELNKQIEHLRQSPETLNENRNPRPQQKRNDQPKTKKRLTMYPYIFLNKSYWKSTTNIS